MHSHSTYAAVPYPAVCQTFHSATFSRGPRLNSQFRFEPEKFFPSPTCSRVHACFTVFPPSERTISIATNSVEFTRYLTSEIRWPEPEDESDETRFTVTSVIKKLHVHNRCCIATDASPSTPVVCLARATPLYSSRSRLLFVGFEDFYD